MYSILITGFYILTAVLVAGIAVVICKQLQKSGLPEKETDIDSTFHVTRMPLPQTYFVNMFVVFVFLLQTVMMFPLAVAFNRLRSFVFFEAAVFVVFLILALWYAIQKNMLRIKE